MIPLSRLTAALDQIKKIDSIATLLDADIDSVRLCIPHGGSADDAFRTLQRRHLDLMVAAREFIWNLYLDLGTAAKQCEVLGTTHGPSPLELDNGSPRRDLN